LRASVAALAKTLAIGARPDEPDSREHLIPGRIDTDRVRQLDEDTTPTPPGLQPTKQHRAHGATIPLGRYGPTGGIRPYGGFSALPTPRRTSLAQSGQVDGWPHTGNL